jgi:hypothetical protein
MKVIGTIIRPECTITLFHWNNKYLLKLEAGPFEQTYKVDEYELATEDDLRKIINEDFMSEAMERFADMGKSLHLALEKI